MDGDGEGDGSSDLLACLCVPGCVCVYVTVGQTTMHICAASALVCALAVLRSITDTLVVAHMRSVPVCAARS